MCIRDSNMSVSTSCLDRFRHFTHYTVCMYRYRIGSAHLICHSAIFTQVCHRFRRFYAPFNWQLPHVWNRFCHFYTCLSSIPSFLRTIQLTYTIGLSSIPPFLHMSVIDSVVFAYHSIDLYSMSVIGSAVWNRFCYFYTCLSSIPLSGIDSVTSLE